MTAILAAATAASDLRLRQMEDIGVHYVRTLAAWRAKLGDAQRILARPRCRVGAV